MIWLFITKNLKFTDKKNYETLDRYKKELEGYDMSFDKPIPLEYNGE